MKKEKYAVFLDIDNTLLSDGAVPKSNIEAIKRVRSMGNYVFINTARSHACIPPSILKEVPVDGVVAGMGTDLRIGKKRILSEAMDINELKIITDWFMGDGREIGFEGEDVMLWINPGKARNAEYLVHSPDDFNTVYNKTRISKMYVGGHLTAEEFEYFGRTNIMYQHRSYAEFVPKGFGKSPGMKIILKYLGIPKERCIAMGDSSNDEDMLKDAGISVAMGNAVDEIKKICTYISCDAKDGGVAQALEKFIICNDND